MKKRRYFYAETAGSRVEFRDKAQAKAYAKMLRKIGVPTILSSSKQAKLPFRSERSLVEIHRRVSKNPEFWRSRLHSPYGEEESFWKVRAPSRKLGTKHRRTR